MVGVMLEGVVVLEVSDGIVVLYNSCPFLLIIKGL